VKRLLIIDDEPSIQKSIGNLLSSRGYETLHCEDPLLAEKELSLKPFDLVLLDIWMPGLDGYTLLSRIKNSYPRLPVIIMSGHASVTAGVEAAKKGADDFLEKPFSTDLLLAKIREQLGQTENGTLVEIKINRQPFKKLVRPLNRPQKTLAKSGVLKGKGIHSGESTGIILSSSPVGSGIVFEDISTGTPIYSLITQVQSTSFATNLVFEGKSVMCVEHLLSALHALEIDNANIRVNKELPILDGSSLPFCDLIRELGSEEQKENRQAIFIDREYVYADPKDAEKKISIGPNSEPFLEIEYFLELPDTLGSQKVTYRLSAETYAAEIAPARTFGFIDEIKGLQAEGLGQGGSLDNFIMLGENGAVNTEFRLENELARHKILDIIGDLYLAGAPIYGKVKAHKTGHRHTIALLREILRNLN
jgi:UDP-3-O-acyl N-acetylglucosamine deacetylase